MQISYTKVTYDTMSGTWQHVIL